MYIIMLCLELVVITTLFQVANQQHEVNIFFTFTLLSRSTFLPTKTQLRSHVCIVFLIILTFSFKIT